MSIRDHRVGGLLLHDRAELRRDTPNQPTAGVDRTPHRTPEQPAVRAGTHHDVNRNRPRPSHRHPRRPQQQE
jgi:hypothetical protein